MILPFLGLEPSTDSFNIWKDLHWSATEYSCRCRKDLRGQFTKNIHMPAYGRPKSQAVNWNLKSAGVLPDKSCTNPMNILHIHFNPLAQFIFLSRSFSAKLFRWFSFTFRNVFFFPLTSLSPPDCLNSAKVQLVKAGCIIAPQSCSKILLNGGRSMETDVVEEST